MRSEPSPERDLQPVNAPALDLMLRCARESFDAPTLRYLSRESGRLADEEEEG